MQFLLRAAFCFLFLSSSGADLFAASSQGKTNEKGNVEGIYAGSMHLTDGTDRTIPLSLALTFTGETATVNQGSDSLEYKVIDGAFVLDQEGGPYAFTRVSYRIDKSEFDLRYDRQQLTLNRNLPAAFRLVGKLDDNGCISGRVLSGLRGLIGTFRVRFQNKNGLSTQSKYNGAWYGAATIIPDGRRVPFFIELSEGLNAVTNPPNFEVDWTPGKTAAYSWNGTQGTFTSVAIDYLRRHLKFSLALDGVPNALDIDAELDPSGQNFVGIFSSRYGGKRAMLKLRRVR